MDAIDILVCAFAVLLVALALGSRVERFRSVDAAGRRRHRFRLSLLTLREPPETDGQVALKPVSGVPALDLDRCDLVVDTGCGVNMLGSRGLDALDLRDSDFGGALRPVVLSGFGPDTVEVRLSRREPLQLGGLHFPTFTAVRGPAHLDAMVTGVLGLWAMVDRVVVVDLQAWTLEITRDLGPVRARHPWMGEGAELVVPRGKCPRATGRVGERTVVVKIDTGASLSSVPQDLVSSEPVLPGRSARTRGQVGIGGASDRAIGRTPGLEVAGAHFGPGLASAYERPELNLGMDRLQGRVLVLDFPGRRVWIGPPGPSRYRLKSLEEALEEALGEHERDGSISTM